MLGVFLLVHTTFAADCPVGLTNSCTAPPAFPVGRWEFTTRAGSVNISGSFLIDDVIVNGAERKNSLSVSGQFPYSLIGGSQVNYIEVDCDGTVTGKGKDQYDGSTAISSGSHNCPTSLDSSASEVTIIREYEISGQVQPDGSLLLTNKITDGDYSADVDAAWLNTSSEPGECNRIDEHGNAGDDLETFSREVVRLVGTFNATSNIFTAEIRPIKSFDEDESQIYPSPYDAWLPTWLRDRSIPAYPEGCDPEDCDGGHFWPMMMDDLKDGDGVELNTITATLTTTLELRTPDLTDAHLQEPQFFLKNIPYNNTLFVTADWEQSQGGQNIEFVYDGQTTTLSGNSVSFSFDTGADDDRILITPKASEDGAQYHFYVPKVALPGWAGNIGNWSASSGVKYQGWVDWPITLETTRSISANPIFSGQWGLTAKVSSRLDMKANSDGTPGTADFLAKATASFAGRSKELELKGTSTTTLECDKLTVAGFGTANLPLVDWEASMNPISLVLGAKDAACALGRLPCSLTGKAGLSASVKITLTGTPRFGDDGSEIKWTGGSLGGDITATVSLSVVPPPLNKVANVTVEGGGQGCVQFQVAPDLQLETLGGKIFASVTASAMFLGSATATKEWLFGDPCGGGAPSLAAASFTAAGGPSQPGALSLDPGNAVDRNIQLTMALAPDRRAVAAWSEIPAGLQRPSGDIAIKLFDGTNWGAGLLVTSDAQADNGPALAYDGNGNIVLCYQRNPNLPLPTDISQFATFAAGFELHYALLNPTNGSVIATAALTGNSDFDFGPLLRTDTNGFVHLFWQRTDGQSIEGVPGHEASILHRVWNGLEWTAEETVASGLVDSLGWHPAALDANNYFVALVLDHDGDLETEGDLEIHVRQKSAGVWQPLAQVTTNSLPDNSPVAGFNSSGQPVLVWRENSQLKGLIGSLQTDVTTIVAAPLEVGPTFANGLLRTQGDDLWLVWPGANDVYFTRLHDGTWQNPTILAVTDDADELFDVRVEGDASLLLASASTAFAPDFETLASTSRIRAGLSTVGPREGSIESAKHDGAEVILALLGEGQTQYVLQGTPSLTNSAGWKDLTTVTTQTDGRLLVREIPPTDTSDYFYRLKRVD